mgnify:FL=1
MTDKRTRQRINAIADRLKKDYHAQAVIPFGSAGRGEASAESDTDLLVIAPTRQRFCERSAAVLGLLRDLYPGLALEPIVLTPEEVQRRLERGDPFVKDIMESGVAL